MRKIFFILAIIFILGLSSYADTPLPNMRPAAPDVPSEVKSDEGDYLPNVVKPHKEEEKANSQEQSADEVGDDSEEDIEETEEDVQETQEQSDNTPKTAEPETPLEEVLEGEKNPINNDSTEENIKNKNFVPEQSTAEDKKNKPVTKVKKNKKEKKQKPKYGKYQGVNEDPYIQSWEEELKNEANESSSESATEENIKEEEQPITKTYTQDDYEQVYRDIQVPTFTFVHGVDPDQYYDMKDTMWSPYPLLRLNSPLYFKTITIEPGYYLLTPREYKGDWYILFKEAGAVKYTIPVFDKSFVSATYYKDNLKELDMTKSARWQVKFLNAWGKHVRKSKRKPAIQCNVELTDLDNNFLLLDLYYGAHKYSTIFRIEKF